jgi:hypothetical protein
VRLARHGLALDLPSGWDGRIYRRALGAGAPTNAVLHAANFALPADRGDYGSGAVEHMGRGHVLVVLIEHDLAAAGAGLFRRQGLPLPLRPADFSPQALQRTLPGQSGVQRFFTWRGRPFCLYVVLGSHAGRARLLPVVNALLGTATVATLA